MNTPLLPHLRSLASTLIGTEACRALVFILSPNLTTIQLHVKGVDSVFVLEGVLQRIASSIRLQFLHLMGLFTPRAPGALIIPALMRTLRELNDLEIIGLEAECFLDADIWDFLGSLPHLMHIQALGWGITRDAPLPIAPLQFDADKFSSLELLAVEARIETLIKLFESGMPPRMDQLQLYVTDLSSELDTNRLVQAMKNHNRMSDFYIGFESATYRVHSSLLDHISAWKNLTALDIRTRSQAELTDEEFGRLAAAMPNLIRLGISTCPEDFAQIPAATFGALCNIARACPHLRSLGIFHQHRSAIYPGP